MTEPKTGHSGTRLQTESNFQFAQGDFRANSCIDPKIREKFFSEESTPSLPEPLHIEDRFFIGSGSIEFKTRFAPHQSIHCSLFQAGPLDLSFDLELRRHAAFEAKLSLQDNHIPIRGNKFLNLTGIFVDGPFGANTFPMGLWVSNLGSVLLTLSDGKNHLTQNQSYSFTTHNGEQGFSPWNRFLGNQFGLPNETNTRKGEDSWIKQKIKVWALDLDTQEEKDLLPDFIFHGSDTPMAIHLENVFPKVFLDETGKLPDQYDLLDLWNRIVSIPKPKTEKKSLRCVNKETHENIDFSQLLRGSKIKLDFSDIALPGGILVPQFEALAGLSLDSHSGLPSVDIKTLSIRIAEKVFGVNQKTGKALLTLKDALLLENTHTIIRDQRIFHPGIHISQLDSKTLEITGNLLIDVQAELPILGEIVINTPLVFQLRLKIQGGTFVPELQHSYLALLDGRITQAQNNQNLFEGIEIVLTDDPTSKAPINQIASHTTTYKKENFTLTIRGVSIQDDKHYLDASFLLPMFTLPKSENELSYDWYKSFQHLSLFGSLDLTDQKARTELSFKLSPGEFNRDDFTDKFNTQRNFQLDFDLHFNPHESNKADLNIQDGHVEFGLGKSNENDESYFHFSSQIGQLSLGSQIKLHDLTTIFRLAKLNLSEQVVGLKILEFDLQANKQGRLPKQGLLRNELHIGLLDAAENLEILWSPMKKSLALCGADLLINIQGITISALEKFSKGKVHSIGMDGRIHVDHWVMDLEKLIGEGKIYLSSDTRKDRNINPYGDLYFLDRMGNQVKQKSEHGHSIVVPLFRNTRWTISRLGQRVWEKNEKGKGHFVYKSGLATAPVYEKKTFVKIAGQWVEYNSDFHIDKKDAYLWLKQAKTIHSNPDGSKTVTWELYDPSKHAGMRTSFRPHLKDEYKDYQIYTEKKTRWIKSPHKRKLKGYLHVDSKLDTRFNANALLPFGQQPNLDLRWQMRNQVQPYSKAGFEAVNEEFYQTVIRMMTEEYLFEQSILNSREEK